MRLNERRLLTNTRSPSGVPGKCPLLWRLRRQSVTGPGAYGMERGHRYGPGLYQLRIRRIRHRHRVRESTSSGAQSTARCHHSGRGVHNRKGSALSALSAAVLWFPLQLPSSFSRCRHLPPVVGFIKSSGQRPADTSETPRSHLAPLHGPSHTELTRHHRTAPPPERGPVFVGP